MRLLPERPNWSVALVVLLALLVAAIAVLQYRLVGQLTEDRRVILLARLDSSTSIFRRAFLAELMDLVSIVRPEFPQMRLPDDNRRLARPPEPEIDFAGNFSRWRKTSPHPQLAANVWVVDVNGSAARLDPDGFVLVADSPDLGSVLNACAEGRRGWAWRIVTKGSGVYLWRPLLGRPQPDAPERSRGHVVIQLNAKYMWHTMVPALLDRAFVDRDQYEIAIVDSKVSGTNPVLSGNDNLMHAQFRPDVRGPLLPEPTPPPNSPWPANRRGPQFFTFCGDTQNWELLIRHRAGSVGDEVGRFRMRNLILSGAVLLLLSSSIALLWMSNRRAHQLARAQMAFAAGISHELRTPLAVIRSAADNLADGAVSDGESVREHGNLIQSESRRLTTMVEDILSFAAMHSGRNLVNLKPVDVAGVIGDAVRHTQGPAAKSGMRIEEQIDADLPPVLADASALSRSIQNLVTNAIKYASEGKWVGVYAMRARNSNPSAVLIQICDRGPGIRSEDLPRIFEPFYQARPQEGRKGGVGLGLSLTRDLMRAMHGDVSVNSSPGGGACFTLKVPLADTNEQTDSAG